MNKIEMTKGDDVKIVDLQETKDLLTKEGWSVKGEKPVGGNEDAGDIEELRAEAKEMDIKHHPALGAAKLAALIQETKDANEE